MAFADPSGECRRIFKSSKDNIKTAENILENTHSLYKDQESSINSKNISSVKTITRTIDNKLTRSKSLFQTAIKTLSRAFRLCSGRSGKARRLTEDAKEGIKKILFKENFNQRVLANL